MKSDLIERLVSCFGYIGPANSSIPDKFAHRVRPDFIHSSISPCILKPGESLAAGDLDRLREGLFKGYVGPKDRLNPFFSVLGTPEQRQETAKTAEASGWVEYYRDAIEHFDSFIEAKRAPEGVRFDQGDVQKDAELRGRIIRMSQIVFGMPDSMADTLEKIVLESEYRVFGVCATDRQGTDVASGLVMCKGDAGFFTGGSILESHRGRGLWRHIARFRQEQSYDAGVRHWFYNTVNPRLVKKGDRSTEMVTYFLTK